MNHMKIFILLALAAAALTAFAATAAATELTSPEGTKLGVGATIKTEAEGAITLDGTINISCQDSTAEYEVTNAGGAGKAVILTRYAISYEHCGNHTIEIKKGGTLEIHTDAGGNGTLRLSGSEVTVLTHSLFLGTRHCIYITDSTHVGTLTDTTTTGGTSTQDIDGAPIPQLATDSLCGDDSELTGRYSVTSPNTLYVD